MRVLIVDDEPLARSRLRHMLETDGHCQVVGEASDGRSASRLIEELKPDLAFLDVRMPGQDGLSLATQLRQQAPATLVIFVTAYQEHALAAFETEAVDYLLKPIRAERLSEALQRAEKLHRLRLVASSELAERYLSSVVRGVVRRVAINDIRLLQADHKYVTAFWPGGELIIEASLKTLETEYPECFLRIHRNTLVGRRHVERLQRDTDGNVLVTVQGVSAPLQVSRRLVAEVRRSLRTE